MKVPLLSAAAVLGLGALLVISPNLALGAVIALVGLFVYFLPSVVAVSRNKRNAAAIFVLNLLLGWTLIGWVLALVWASAHEAPVGTVLA